MLSLRIFHNSSVTTRECTGKIRTFLLYVKLMDVDKLIRRFIATEAILTEDKAILQVARDIQQPQDLVQNIHMESEEEEAGDVMVGEPLSDEGEIDAPGDQLRSTSTAYLLRIKEMHNLSQTAVDEIVQSTNTLVSTAVKSVCVNIANQLQNIVHEDDDVLPNITWQTLFEQNSQEASPFKDLETENRQRQAYKEMFGLVVSIKNKHLYKHRQIAEHST